MVGPRGVRPRAGRCWFARRRRNLRCDHDGVCGDFSRQPASRHRGGAAADLSHRTGACRHGRGCRRESPVPGSRGHECAPRFGFDPHSTESRPRGVRFPRFAKLDGGAGIGSRCGRSATALAVQHHLFVGDHGRAQRHRAAAFTAMVERGALAHVGLRPRVGHAARHAVVFQYDPGHAVRRARNGRHRRVDGQIFSTGLSRSRRAMPGDAHDIGSGAIPAVVGRGEFRPP